MTPSGPPSDANDPEPLEPDPRGTEDPAAAEGLGSAHPGDPESAPEVRDKADGPLTRLTALGTDTRIAALATRLDELDAELAAQGSRLRDAERSLVDRIADVDDDRRRGQSQLQRAVQTQSDALDGRLRRLGGLTGLGLLLIAALTAGGLLLGLYLGQQRIEELQGDVTSELQTLGLELGRLKATSAEQDRIEARIAALSETIDRVSVEVAQNKTAAETRPAADAATDLGAEPSRMALLDERIARLESDQQGLIAEIGALRQTLAAATAPPAEPPRADALAEQIARLETDQRALLAEFGTMRQALAVTTTAPENAAHAGAAEVRGTETAPAPRALRTPATEVQVEQGAAEAESVSVPPAAGAAPATVGQSPSADRPYMLQLMGSHDRGAVLAVAARPDLPQSVFIRQETLRGRPWFVLIHSLHPTQEAAQAERDRLPGELARLKTWIRRLPPDAVLEPIASGRAP